MENFSIGFFGAGNMSEAIAVGIRKHFPHAQFYFYTPSKDKAKKLSSKLNGIFVEDFSMMPNNLNFYFLGFKPQNLEDFHFTFKSDAKIISMLAGISIEKIKTKFQIQNVLRIMPNTPMRIGQGVTLAIFSDSFELNQKLILSDVFKKISHFVLLNDEKALDQLTAYTGSMPGILFEIFSMFQKSMEQWNISNLDQRLILTRSILGSVLLMDQELDKSFIELRDEVTSKKGITEKAISSLNEANLSAIIHQAFVEAYKKSQELKDLK